MPQVTLPQFSTADGLLVSSSRPDLAAAVLARWHERLRPFYPREAIAVIAPGNGGAEDRRSDALPGARAAAWNVWDQRVWVHAPHRARVETRLPGGRQHLTLITETAWVSLHPSGTLGGRFPADERLREADREARYPDAALALLRPQRLMRGYELRPVGEALVGARQATRVRGIPAYDARSVAESGGELAPAVFLGAEEAEFFVDAERGVVLRWVGLVAGDAYEVAEFVDIAFDRPLDARLFEPNLASLRNARAPQDGR